MPIYPRVGLGIGCTNVFCSFLLLLGHSKSNRGITCCSIGLCIKCYGTQSKDLAQLFHKALARNFKKPTNFWIIFTVLFHIYTLLLHMNCFASPPQDKYLFRCIYVEERWLIVLGQQEFIVLFSDIIWRKLNSWHSCSSGWWISIVFFHESYLSEDLKPYLG
jgi:hypothetical protein